MRHGQRAAVLILLDREMLKRGSWCGETHIQKAAFLLQELMGVELEYEFVLYRHGPFSFDLRDELSLMQADDLLSVQLRHPAYGPSFIPTEFSEAFLERFPKTTARHSWQIEFIADELRNRNVAELERIATAFYLTQRAGQESTREKAEMLTDLKPHISPSDARDAFEYVDGLMERAANRA